MVPPAEGRQAPLAPRLVRIGLLVAEGRVVQPRGIRAAEARPGRRSRAGEGVGAERPLRRERQRALLVHDRVGMLRVEDGLRVQAAEIAQAQPAAVLLGVAPERAGGVRP